MTIGAMLINSDLIGKGSLIDGAWNETSSSLLKVINPSSLEVISELPLIDESEIENAILNSVESFEKFKLILPKERGEMLGKWYELIIENKEDLAKIITLECGKVLKEARSEVEYAASFIKWYSEEAKRIDGDIIVPQYQNQQIMVLRGPVGVCGVITPWNFPSAMLTRKVAPALAAGCSVIARPSSQTPLSALALGYLALKAGIPQGVFNVIIGNSGVVSRAFLDSPHIRKLSFTGSTEVGKSLYQGSAATLKRLSLELGGNAPFIVCEDAQLDDAIGGLIRSKFRNSGQTCVCVNRVFVSSKIEQEFLTLLKGELNKLKVGDGLDDGSDIGPLINQDALTHAQELIKDAIEKGAQLICGGKSYTNSNLKGSFLTPTLLVNCNDKMRIFSEEIFAPIIAVYSYSDEDVMLKLVNKVEQGLAAYFYTNDLKRTFKLTQGIECGMIAINSGVISVENAPFGGVKASGFGREGGKYGIDEYLNYKYISLNF